MNKWQWRGIISVLFALSLVVVWSAGTAVAQVKAEVCNDGIDNDGDKLVDCADPDCANDAACKKTTADCSPGYYKKHPNTWDDGICCSGDALTFGTECNGIYLDLCAECGATAADRAAAKALLDACFGTAEASPCNDD